MAKREETKKELISTILAIWKKYPDLRFMQMLINVLPSGENYYIEDTEVLLRLQNFVNGTANNF